MKICVLGAGGLGSVLGGFLAKSGVDVTLICRPAHAEAIHKNGLKLTGVRGEHIVREHLTAVSFPAEAKGPFDYLMLTTKSKDTEKALEDAEVIKNDIACAFSMQNNIIKEDMLASWIGKDKVMGASTIEGGTLVGPGHADNHLTVTTTAYFGELNGTISPRVEAITEAFNKAGFATKAVTNIKQVLWEKLTQIANASSWAASTLVALPELRFPEGWSVKEGVEHYVILGKELLSVYKALGFTPQNFYTPISRLKELDLMTFDEAVELLLAQGKKMKEQGARSTTSMHEDILRRRKTEVDFIIKPFLDKAEELSKDTPTVRAAYRIIKTIDTYLNP